MRYLATIAAAILLLTACDPNIADAGGSSSRTISQLGDDNQVKITVTSDPANAKLWVGGELVGYTPATVSVPANEQVSYQVIGNESFEEYDLYKPYNGTINASNDENISVWLTRTTADEQTRQREAYEREQARKRRAMLEATVQASRWRLVEKRDPITDEDRSYLYNVPVDQTSSSIYDPAFYIICDNEWTYGIRPYISTDDYIGDQDYHVPVDYRFDDGQSVQRAQWLNSNTGDAAFVPNQTRASFFTAMSNAERLIMRVYDYRNAYETYEFNVTGAGEALELLGCYTGPLGP